MPALPAHPSILIECCIASVDDAIAAMAGGADRVELNSAIEVGGLTPSAGLIEMVRRIVTCPLIVMCRPRAGGFVYSAAEWSVLRRDAERAMELGADGIAFGAITAAGKIDAKRSAEIVRLVETSPLGQAVFHRAFDDAKDPKSAIKALKQAGVDRLMTSGGRTRASEGITQIAALVKLAGKEIEILPAGGISPDNVRKLVERTGCTQVHGTFRGTAPGRPGYPSQFGPTPTGTCANTVGETRKRLEGLGR